MVGCGKKDNTDNVEKNDQTTENKGQADENKDSTQVEPSGFVFKHNGIEIYMNTDVAPVIEALGEPLHYFESESCAFKGLDKVYTYGGFEISTYPLDGKDYISSIDLKDDTVSTTENISLGSTVEEMISVYGEDYTQSAGAYTYVKEESKLQFVVNNNDEIIGITYLAIVEGLE